MSENTKGRVEMKLGHAGYGTFGTQERIDTLREQRRQHERLTRPPPAQPFAQVLGDSDKALTVKQRAVQTAEANQTPSPDEAARTIRHPARPGRRGPIFG